MKISIITTAVALLASSNNLVAAKKIRGDKKADSVLPDGAIPAIFPDGDIGADSLTDCGLAKCPRGYICDTGGPTSGNAYCVPCGQLDQPCCDDESNAAAFSGCATQGLFCDLTTDPLVGPLGSGTCTTQACGANTASCCPGWECDFIPFDATTGTFNGIWYVHDGRRARGKAKSAKGRYRLIRTVGCAASELAASELASAVDGRYPSHTRAGQPSRQPYGHGSKFG